MGFTVDKLFPVTLGIGKGFLPIPLRGDYPVSRIFLEVDELYAVSGSRGDTDTIRIFRSTHAIDLTG
jgi:hypothetical protein